MLSVFSIVLILFLTYTILTVRPLFKQYKRILLIVICVELLIPQGYFFKIGTSEVSFQLALECFLIPYTLYFIVKQHIRVRFFTLCVSLLFLITAMIGILHQYFEPHTGYIMNYDAVGNWDAYSIGINNKGTVKISWMRFLSIYVSFITVIITIWVFKYKIKHNDLKLMLSKVNKILKFNVCFVLIEFLLKNVFMSKRTLLLGKVLFGEGANTYSELIIRNGIYQLQGITREPSHLALTLFFTLVLFVIEKKILHCKFKITSYMYIFSIVIIMYLSGSFASLLYVMVFLIWCVYMYASYSNRYTKFILYGAVIFLLMYFINILYTGNVDGSSYLGRRIGMSTEMLFAVTSESWQGMGGDSALPRFLSIYETFSDFLTRPFFGMGVGIQISHGGIANVLSDVGLIGVLLWLCVVFRYSKYDIKSLAILLLGSNILLSSGNLFGSVYIIFFIACFRKYKY